MGRSLNTVTPARVVANNAMIRSAIDVELRAPVTQFAHQYHHAIITNVGRR
jgi:hypothetical protein